VSTRDTHISHSDMCQIIKNTYRRECIRTHVHTRTHTHTHAHTHKIRTHTSSYSTSRRPRRPCAPWSAGQVWRRLRSACLLSPRDRSGSLPSAPYPHPVEAADSKMSIRRYTTRGRSTCVPGSRCRALLLIAMSRPSAHLV